MNAKWNHWRPWICDISNEYGKNIIQTKNNKAKVVTRNEHVEMDWRNFVLLFSFGCSKKNWITYITIHVKQVILMRAIFEYLLYDILRALWYNIVDIMFSNISLYLIVWLLKFCINKQNQSYPHSSTENCWLIIQTHTKNMSITSQRNRRGTKRFAFIWNV